MKSIVDPARMLRPIGMGCHHFEYADNACAVNERGEPVHRGRRNRFKKALRPFYRQLAPVWDALNLDPYNGTDITNRSLSVEHLRINHYAVKSREEFLRKSSYKKEKRRYEGIDYFAYHDRNEVFDPILMRYLPVLERQLAAMDSPALPSGIAPVTAR